MKFLKETEIMKEKNGVKITFKGVTSSQQVALITMAMDNTLVGRVKLAELILKNIVETLEIDGEKHKPLTVANSSDLSDPATKDVYFLISALVMEETLLHAATKKKSGEPELPTDQEKDVENAQTVAKENPLVSALHETLLNE